MGQEKALRAGERLGVEVLTGIEFSIREEGVSIHLLGYCFDHADAGLNGALRDLEAARIERAREMVERFAGLGYQMRFEEVLREAGSGTVGRPHLARIMLRRGYVSGFQEAFDRFLAEGAPCYVPKRVLPLTAVIALIRGAGGAVVWAHPGTLVRNVALLERLCSAGIAGIEAWHPNHSAERTREILAAAERERLFCTGGSDYHFTEAMQADIGGIGAPYESVIAIRRAAGR
jgi:predicted metal-dependent phosphoesterase TrpH